MKNILAKALNLHKNGDFDQAEVFYKEVLSLQHRNFDALHFLGVLYATTNKFDLAVDYLSRALKINPAHAQALFNRGNLYFQLNKLQLSLSDLNKSILLDPINPIAFFLLGNIQYSLSNFLDSISSYKKAIDLNPFYSEAFCNLGNAYKDIDFLQESINCFNKAIQLNSNLAEAFSNRGVVNIKLRNYELAINDLQHAININTNYDDAYFNLGTAFKSMKLFENAIQSYSMAITINPSHIEAYVNLANSYRDNNQYEISLITYDKALLIFSDFKFNLSNYLSIKNKLCDWSNFYFNISQVESDTSLHKKIGITFHLLGLIDRPDLHLIAAQTYAASECPSDDSLGPIPLRPFDGKIRVGYYSADFHNHATAFLMAELFELHDKVKFEFYAFSFGPNINDDMRQRLSTSFHQFIDVTNSSDRDVAVLSRQIGIDIAVDLKGYTQDSRANIFAKRCAPVQVSYLGYPGTMGVDYMDYIIADKFVIPESNQHFFTEKVVYLPHSYQVNDSKRIISARVFSKKEVGIPDNAFVFCCFNNNYKILPDTFDIWMRILLSVPNSILWLLDDNPTATSNLIKEAESRGVDGKRLIFAKRIQLDEHLARHRLADLFLDTLPYNAHTTTSDALWAGLPVLTCTGQSFASRVAASLLDAIGLPEMITHNIYDYEKKALELANNPLLLAQIKSKLASNRLTTPLFNTQLFTQHIESAYLQMYQLQQNNLSPQNIYI
jgi:protein O-GlcNAc transferase